MKPSISTSTVGSVTTPKVIRKTSKKRYTNVETAYQESFERCKKLEAEIIQLRAIVKDRKIVSATENEKPVYLSSYQISGYRKQLAEKEAELPKARLEMKRKGKAYGKASNRTAQAAKYQAKCFSERRELSRAALKELDVLKANAMGMVDALMQNNDPRIELLKNLAIKDGRKFHLEFQKLYRSEVQDVRYKQMFSASATLRTELANIVRTSFGWVRKTH